MAENVEATKSNGPHLSQSKKSPSEHYHTIPCAYHSMCNSYRAIDAHVVASTLMLTFYVRSHTHVPSYTVGCSSVRYVKSTAVQYLILVWMCMSAHGTCTAGAQRKSCPISIHATLQTGKVANVTCHCEKLKTS